MGRTIHFSVTKENGKKFNSTEIKKMINISEYYNSGDYENIWTCENFYLSPLNYCPNWEYFKEFGNDAAYKCIDENYKHYEKKGLETYDIIMELKKLNLITFSNEISNVVTGFTKVQGNELNSSLILMALTDISKTFPKMLIEVNDEGHFLYAKLKIKNGKAMPDFDYEKSRMEDWALRTILSKKYEGNVYDNGLKIPFGLNEIFSQNCGLNSPYGNDLIESMNQWLSDMKAIQDVVMKHKKIKTNATVPYFYNLNHFDPKDWFNVSDFCRPVNPSDFKECNVNAGTLMAGFYGEYWNLNPDKDSEIESYKRLEGFKNLFGSKGVALGE